MKRNYSIALEQHNSNSPLLLPDITRSRTETAIYTLQWVGMEGIAVHHP